MCAYSGELPPPRVLPTPVPSATAICGGGAAGGGRHRHRGSALGARGASATAFAADTVQQQAPQRVVAALAVAAAAGQSRWQIIYSRRAPKIFYPSIS